MESGLPVVTFGVPNVMKLTRMSSFTSISLRKMKVLCGNEKNEKSQFLFGRSGDFVFTPFQCDLCSFRNITKRSPFPSSLADKRLMAYIRRANLDVFWSRTPGTVSGSLTGMRKILKCCQELNMSPPFEPLGPWPVDDNQGYRLAISILRVSQEGGKNSQLYTQYDTIRKMVSSFGNHYEVAQKSSTNTWVLRSDKSNTFFTDSPARSEFFKRFQQGLRSRMGRDVRDDATLDFRILHKILLNMNVELLGEETPFKRRRWLATSGAFFVTSFMLGLRGNETLMLDLKGLVDYVQEGNTAQKPQMVVTLLGRFKGEDYQRYHILLIPNKTNSGFEPRKWLEFLIEARRYEGLHEGPAFCDSEGFVLSQQPSNDELTTQLLGAKENYPDLFPLDLDLDDINTSRSFRKGSTSRAQDLQLPESTIDANNRWRSFDKAQNNQIYFTIPRSLR